MRISYLCIGNIRWKYVKRDKGVQSIQMLSNCSRVITTGSFFSFSFFEVNYFSQPKMYLKSEILISPLSKIKNYIIEKKKVKGEYHLKVFWFPNIFVCIFRKFEVSKIFSFFQKTLKLQKFLWRYISALGIEALKFRARFSQNEIFQMGGIITRWAFNWLTWNFEENVGFVRLEEYFFRSKKTTFFDLCYFLLFFAISRHLVKNRYFQNIVRLTEAIIIHFENPFGFCALEMPPVLALFSRRLIPSLSSAVMAIKCILFHEVFMESSSIYIYIYAFLMHYI